MKRRVFISQPMKGLSNKTILELREKYKQDVINIFPDDEIEFIDSIVEIVAKDTSDTSQIRAMSVACLGRSISLMATADVAYFADGWRNSNGCMTEYNICTHYGIPVECSNK